ncbi:hypothetical protein OQJ68_07715 [Microbulbifer thermotolerans]|uniref:Uncharacterized protein n=1 Tax=Microbulbifer thermotolerans TaxID=252514 RepID=A0AB35HW91_MICTH|nr:hypothetical protein [Microbulbifer thermotolerans]MCX2801669.1 hypothetical protein [Microbulbifer thermotolerans]
MREFLRNLSLCFAAGAFGGLCYALGLWAMGHYGFTRWLGVDIAPYLSAGYLYQRIVWGGICGLIFLLPWHRSWFSRGFWLSLIPAGVLLFLLLPMRGYGLGALSLGLMAPLVIILACAIGGIAASGLLRAEAR